MQSDGRRARHEPVLPLGREPQALLRRAQDGAAAPRASGLDAWITGLRREQSVTRTAVHKVEWDEGNKLVKVNPLVDWTHEDVWKYIREHNVPYNALHDRGYPSIGCGPCTRAVQPGEHERAGRWWWEHPETKECGLHVAESGVESPRPSRRVATSRSESDRVNVLISHFREARGAAGAACRGRPCRRVQSRRTACPRAPSVTVVAPEATPAIRELAERRQDRLASARVRAERSRRRDARRRGRAQRRRRDDLSRKRASRRALSTRSTISTTAISTIRPSSLAAICRSRSRRQDTARRSRSASASSSSSSSVPNTRDWIRQLGDARRELFATDMDPERGNRSCTSWPHAVRRHRAAARPAWCIWSARGPAIRSCSR